MNGLLLNLIFPKSKQNLPIISEACDAGYMFNLSSDSCEPCGLGFFQFSVGSFSCVPCGVGKTTLSETSTSEDECRDECSG